MTNHTAFGLGMAAGFFPAAMLAGWVLKSFLSWMDEITSVLADISNQQVDIKAAVAAHHGKEGDGEGIAAFAACRRALAALLESVARERDALNADERRLAVALTWAHANDDEHDRTKCPICACEAGLTDGLSIIEVTSILAAREAREGGKG